MRRFALSALVLALLPVFPAAQAASQGAQAERPFVRLHTEMGEILVVLFADLAPYHARNFQHLAATGFYDRTYFHRIVPGFVIQGGDPNTRDRDPRTDGMGGPTLADVLTEDELADVRRAGAILEAKGYAGLPLSARAALKAEFSPTARHLRGTLSMARSRENDSAGSQFFICVDRAAALDRQYTVFGHVVTGMAVVDGIVSAPVDRARGPEAPQAPVKILRTELLGGRGSLTADEQVAYHEMLAELIAAGSTW